MQNSRWVFLWDKYKNSGLGNRFVGTLRGIIDSPINHTKKSEKGIKKPVVASFIEEEKMSKRNQRTVHEY